MTTTDHRKAAEGRIDALVSILQNEPVSELRDGLIEECAALAVAIRAFHMEGIRFRMFNVDRILSRGLVSLPAEAHTAFSEARGYLEAAGFQTRSHQAPQ